MASIYFLIWLQYIVYDPAFPAFINFAIVFFGMLSMSWALTVLLRTGIRSQPRSQIPERS
jgi:hypothetical protein